MITDKELIAAETRLALLLGHATAELSGDVLWVPEGEGTTPFPAYARKHEAAFQLQVDYGVILETNRSDGTVYAKVQSGDTDGLDRPMYIRRFIDIAEHPSKHHAAMYAGIVAVIAKLEGLRTP